MANPKGNPQNLKRPPKGGPSPNPGGRPPDMLRRALKKLTKTELEDIATIVVKGSIADLEALLKNKQTTIIKAMVAGVAIKAIKNGDSSAFNALLDRMIGRVPAKDSLHFTGDGTLAAPTVVVNIPSNGREVKKPDANGK